MRRSYNRTALDEQLATIGKAVEVNFDDSDTFTAREVHNLLSRPVKAQIGGFVKAGTAGTISEYRRTPSGWLIVVTWTDGTTDVFSKKDARKSLQLGSRQ